MLIRIEASSGIPLTRQIVDQVRAPLRLGHSPGRRPPPPASANWPASSPSTRTPFFMAYERITAEGILELRTARAPSSPISPPASR